MNLEYLKVKPGDIVGDNCEIVQYHKLYKSRHYIQFKCRCGKLFITNYREVLRLKSRSCGCLAKQLTSERSKKHGLFGTPEYQAWNNMRRRCLNPKDQHYHNYGGRGIKVCERWLNSPEVFLEDMGKRPSPLYSLDRKNVDGDYTPDNCKWSDLDEQNNNKRNTIKVEYQGQRMSLVQWSKQLDINYNTLMHRYHRGLTGKQLFTN